ncbi:hypothetical protein NHX12_018040 [Muraenolepis orangiensis]|uniref:C2H2-type domain-containing protein n=1 Tax=Muraenolepis orangiensis TaxID=630683 RepID=A0A9Q0EXL3_9TELE|nr:hypothetical protein NHX12_018040 [Muraenolepis orangiensis]
MSSPVDFHSQIASIIEVLANAAVAEICKVVDDGYAVVQLEVSQNHKENDFLRRKVRLLELQSRFRGRGQKTAPSPRDQDSSQQVVTSTKIEAAEAAEEEEPSVLMIVKVEGAELNESDHPSDRPDTGSGPTPPVGPEEPCSQSEVSGSDDLTLLFTSGCSQVPLTECDLRAGSRAFLGGQEEGWQDNALRPFNQEFTHRTAAPVMLIDEVCSLGGVEREAEKGRKEEGEEKMKKKIGREEERGREVSGREEERGREASGREEERGREESFTASLAFNAVPGPSLAGSLAAHKLYKRAPPVTLDPRRLGPHVCSVCRKRFAQEAELQKHAARHRRRRAHVCALCGKSFVCRSQLDIHGYVHTGEQPFGCNKCPRHFSHPSNLRRHQKVTHNC